MAKTRIKEKIDFLLEVEKVLNEFNEQTITPDNRKLLSNEIRKIVESGFYRNDNNNSIELYSAKQYYDFKMSPDITICKTHENKYHVDTWPLFKTIQGLQEQLQEY